MIGKWQAWQAGGTGGRSSAARAAASARAGALAALACVALLASPGVALAQQTPDNTEPGRLVVPLSGTATVQRDGSLVASPARFDTGLIEIGDYKPIAITLTHGGGAGSEPLAIGAATLIGKSAEEYTSDFAGFRTLSPGESLTVGITFTPRTPGTKSAGLRLDVDGSSAPYVVLLDGRSRYPLTADLGPSATKVTFGQAITGAALAQTFTLSNLGDAESPSIDVSGITLDGDTPEAFATDFLPTLLAPGESLEVTATMSSPTAGTKSAALTIVHDGNNPPVEVALEGVVVQPAAVPVNFSQSKLQANQDIQRGTSIQFGPDGKLYVSEMDGPIHVFDVTRQGKNAYAANKLETINLIKNVTNHDDDGSSNPFLGKRLLTGFLVTGSAAQPVIYAASSDPRQAAGPSGTDSNLDTNSGILHKLTKNGGNWSMQDLVRGLPRSEENHVANGILLVGNKILLSVGGNTNQGVPSNNFAQLPEYALSAAALEIDLGKINGTYDLPTLDDEDRAGTSDANDPFGGNDGKNQAKLVAGGPVQIYASGLRNAYDLVLTESGKLYTFDNGPNTGWGGTPKGNCANDSDDGGDKHEDHLHLLSKGYYAGHPNPARGNKNNTFNASNPQSPIEVAANPVECQYKAHWQDGSLTSINASSNGMDEYTASNFGGAMKGDLLVASFGKKVYRIELNGSGTNVTSKSQLGGSVGNTPLDLTAQGDGDPFPGTIWVVDNLDKQITVLEPADY